MPEKQRKIQAFFQAASRHESDRGRQIKDVDFRTGEKNMNKFGKKLVIVLMASSMLVTPVYAAPNTNEIQAQKEQKEQEVKSLQQQLQSMVTKIADLEQQMITKGEKVIQAKEDLAKAEEQQKEQYEAMKLRIKYMYEQGDVSALEDLFTSSSIADFLNKADYIETVHRYDREKLQEYVDTKEKIEKLKQQLEDDLKKMETMQASFEKEKEQLNATIQSKQAEVSDLNQQLQEAVRKAAEEQQKKEEEEAKKRQEEQRQDNTEQTPGNSDDGDSTPSNPGGNTPSRPDAGGSGNTGNSGNSGSSNTGNTSVAQAIVNAAYSCLGTPYVWGGNTPGSGLDCSGLVKYAHNAAGITNIARQSGPIGSGGKAVSSPLPGDVVCYSGHVGIYIGGGQMIHAPEPGDVVKVAAVYGSPWYRRYW